MPGGGSREGTVGGVANEAGKCILDASSVQSPVFTTLVLLLAVHYGLLIYYNRAIKRVLLDRANFQVTPGPALLPTSP